MIVDVLKKSRIALCRILEVVLIVAVFVLVIDVLWGVFTRYVMGEQADWTGELARFLLIWVSLLGGAVAFGEKAHLGVDYFVGLFDSSAQKFLAVFAQLVVLFFATHLMTLAISFNRNRPNSTVSPFSSVNRTSRGSCASRFCVIPTSRNSLGTSARAPA